MIDFKDCYDDLVEWYNRLDDKDRSSHIVDCLEALKTLVDKATPKKPIKEKEQGLRYVTSYSCPNCHKIFLGAVADYCFHCGQRLDWSEDETSR